MSQPKGQGADEADSADTDIAVVGSAGRFPDAVSVAEYWRNLRDGVESVQFFSDEQLAEAGVSAALLKQPNYIRASAILDDIALRLDDVEFDLGGASGFEGLLNPPGLPKGQITAACSNTHVTIVPVALVEGSPMCPLPYVSAAFRIGNARRS